MPRSARVTPGDGHALQRFRWWQQLSRSLFHLHLSDESGVEETWSVDVRHAGDSNGEVNARLHRDGVHHARSEFPATFAVPGGAIEVVATSFGLRRCHYVTHAGVEWQLVPDPASAEGRRARLEQARPVLSRAMGLVSVSVLALALVLGVPQIIEQITQIPAVAQRVGTFISPFHISGWANTALFMATVVASTERALRLRYNLLLDGGLFPVDS